MAAALPVPSFENQIAYRAQKALGILGGSPTYQAVDSFEKPEAPSRVFQYSPDGRLFAYALPTSVRILSADTNLLLRELPVPAVEINFSPLGTYISTWERPIKLEDGWDKNLRVWDIATGEEVYGLYQKSQEGWDLQYTNSESHAVRHVGSEILVFRPGEWSRGPVDRLRVEGLTSVTLSPGINPSIAVFLGEKKGAPASMRIHSLLTLASPPSSQKSFYKADRTVVKWNKLGTHVLFLTHVDVDKTNKNYYGENNLYMLTAAGTFDCRVMLDKEGPIHDFAWSPNSKEFLVIYGYMPSKVTLFDQRVNPIHNFPTHPRNFVSFNPQGRLLAVAGFGNLSAGNIEIYDRRTLEKVSSFDAANTSWCEWSPCGRFLLTATLSPRLRVDNGLKVWHCTGTLLHVFNQEELYQVGWRSAKVESVPPFEQTLPSAPPASDSVVSQRAAASPAPKAAGAYRPPGARGMATPDVYKREDEGGAAYTPSSGTVTPTKHAANGHHTNGNGVRKQRYVPGAPTPPLVEEKEKSRRKKNNKKKDASASPAGTPDGDAIAEAVAKLVIDPMPTVDTLVPDVSSPLEPSTPGGDPLDPLQKKIRSVNKKLKAIEELKDKANRGEKLEATQVRKMDTEAELRRELSTLAAA